MSAPARENKISKADRKLLKKCNKSRSTLLKHEGIKSIDCPSKILCVSNAGLDNNVTQDEVYELFGCHGNICDVIMLPRKPYSFVCFLHEEDAESAYTALNGYKLEATGNRKEELTLYISYVSQAPCSIQPSKTLPPGLILLEDFISDDYAAEIVSSINWDTGCKDQEKELKHRKVKHYGYEFKYSINNVDPDEPLPEGIPEVYRKLLDKALETGYVRFYPDQLTINQYQPGQGIPPHVDTTSAFEDGLMSLSLGSQVNMEFRHPDGRQLSVLLPPNSLLIMTGESRFVWSHGITPRKHDIVPGAGAGLTLSNRGVRTSFTFRKITGVKPEEDSKGEETPDLLLSNSEAAELEQQHVHQVYEEIASHFSGTRHTPWPNIVEFLQKQEPGSMLADFGCGNGKYFGVNKNLFEVGSDRSLNLAEICKERKFEVFVGDVLSIPLRAGVFDVCLCIAVIHHLATEERRLKAIEELMKILRVGGKALIYVWAMEQELIKVKSKYLKNPKQQNSYSCDIENESHKSNEVSKTASLGKVEDSFDEGQNSANSYLKAARTDDSTSDSVCEKVCDMQVTKGASETDIVTLPGLCDTEVIHKQVQEHCENKDSTPNTHSVATLTANIGNATHTKKTDDKTNSHSVATPTTKGLNSDDRKVTHGDCSSELDSRNKMQKTDERNEVTVESSLAMSTTGNCDIENIKQSETGVNGDEKSKDEGTGATAVKPKLQVHVNRTEFKQQDLLVPWHLKGKKKPEKDFSSENTFHRFYHVFKKGELELLCSKVPDCKIIHSYYDQGNWAVILEKT